MYMCSYTIWSQYSAVCYVATLEVVLMNRFINSFAIRSACYSHAVTGMQRMKEIILILSIRSHFLLSCSICCIRKEMDVATLVKFLLPDQLVRLLLNYVYVGSLLFK